MPHPADCSSATTDSEQLLWKKREAQKEKLALCLQLLLHNWHWLARQQPHRGKQCFFQQGSKPETTESGSDFLTSHKVVLCLHSAMPGTLHDRMNKAKAGYGWYPTSFWLHKGYSPPSSLHSSPCLLQKVRVNPQYRIRGARKVHGEREALALVDLFSWILPNYPRNRFKCTDLYMGRGETNTL